MKSVALGNTSSMIAVGKWYEYGKIEELDLEKALKYYLAAASKGSGEGAYLVAHIKMIQYEEYANPNSPFDPEIVKWLNIGIERKCLSAKVAMANMYFNGIGVSKDEIKAIKMIEEVDTALISSLFCCGLAEYYMKSDPLKALKWAKAAYKNAENNNEYWDKVEPAKILGMIYLKGGKEVYDYQLAIKYLKEAAKLEDYECKILVKSLGETIEE